MSIKLTGFDKLQREFEDAQRALGALDGTISTLKFDPTDRRSVQKAIQQMESAIDSKVARSRQCARVAVGAENERAISQKDS